MKKLLLAAGIGMCIFAMASADTTTARYDFSDLKQDTVPKKKKDTTKPKKDTMSLQVVSPVK